MISVLLLCGRVVGVVHARVDQIVTVGRREPGRRFQRSCTLRLIISGTATTKVVRQVMSGSAIPRRHGGRSIGPHPRPGAAAVVQGALGALSLASKAALRLPMI